MTPIRRREDHAVPKDSYYLVRVAEFAARLWVLPFRIWGLAV